MADPQTPQTGLTFLGKLIVGLLALGLIGAGGWLLREQLFPTVGPGASKSPPETTQTAQAPAAESATPGPEAKDTAGITTVKEYKYVPGEKLPPVKGVSSYKFTDNTVVFPINMWIGWLPIVAANRGFKPNAESDLLQEVRLQGEPEADRRPGGGARRLRRGRVATCCGARST